VSRVRRNGHKQCSPQHQDGDTTYRPLVPPTNRLVGLAHPRRHHRRPYRS
jgi:hypothetical protein